MVRFIKIRKYSTFAHFSESYLKVFNFQKTESSLVKSEFCP